MTGIRDQLLALSVSIRERLRRNDGATAVEYGIMVGLIAVAIIAAVILLGGHLADLFTTVSSRLPNGS